MNILTLNKDISLYEIKNEFYFDLEDIAGKLGYAKPKDAIRDFVRRNADFRFRTARCGDGRKLFDEPSLYYFLMRSEAPKAKEWQFYICTEVLPLIRRVGIAAVKELEASQLLSRELQGPELLPQLEKLVDDVDQFCTNAGAYRVLGYLPPSEVKPKGWSLAEFWAKVEEVGIENLDHFYTPKYHNSYRSDGKWYAFKPGQFDTWEQPSVSHSEDLLVGELV